MLILVSSMQMNIDVWNYSGQENQIGILDPGTVRTGEFHRCAMRSFDQWMLTLKLIGACAMSNIDTPLRARHGHSSKRTATHEQSMEERID